MCSYAELQVRAQEISKIVFEGVYLFVSHDTPVPRGGARGISLQAGNSVLVIRVFVERYDRETTRSQVVCMAEAGVSLYKAVLKELIRFEPRLNKLAFQIGVYHDYGSGSVQLASLDEDGVPSWIHPWLV